MNESATFCVNLKYVEPHLGDSLGGNFLHTECFIMRLGWVTWHIYFRNYHSGETDEANCSWLHPVWPPPKRPDQDSTFCVVSRASTELIFCTHRIFYVRNNVYKPRRLVCECCRDISTWKSRVMKPTVLRDPGRMKPTEYMDEANWFSNWTDEANCW